MQSTSSTSFHLIILHPRSGIPTWTTYDPGIVWHTLATQTGGHQPSSSQTRFKKLRVIAHLSLELKANPFEQYCSSKWASSPRFGVKIKLI